MNPRWLKSSSGGGGTKSTPQGHQDAWVANDGQPCHPHSEPSRGPACHSVTHTRGRQRTVRRHFTETPAGPRLTASVSTWATQHKADYSDHWLLLLKLIFKNPKPSVQRGVKLRALTRQGSSSRGFLKQQLDNPLGRRQRHCWYGRMRGWLPEFQAFSQPSDRANQV